MTQTRVSSTTQHSQREEQPTVSGSNPAPENTTAHGCNSTVNSSQAAVPGVHKAYCPNHQRIRTLRRSHSGSSCHCDVPGGPLQDCSAPRKARTERESISRQPKVPSALWRQGQNVSSQFIMLSVWTQLHPVRLRPLPCSTPHAPSSTSGIPSRWPMSALTSGKNGQLPAHSCATCHATEQQQQHQSAFEGGVLANPRRAAMQAAEDAAQTCSSLD